jgi:hypothetical protein
MGWMSFTKSTVRTAGGGKSAASPRAGSDQTAASSRHRARDPARSSAGFLTPESELCMTQALAETAPAVKGGLQRGICA